MHAFFRVSHSSLKDGCGSVRMDASHPSSHNPRMPHVMPTQVFIFCVNKREVVQDYMARSKWPSSVSVCTSVSQCMLVGVGKTTTPSVSAPSLPWLWL